MTKIRIKRVQTKASQNFKDPKKILKKEVKPFKMKPRETSLHQASPSQSKVIGKIGCGSLILVIILSIAFGAIAGSLGSGLAKYWVAKYILGDKNANQIIEETQRITVDENSATIDAAKKVSPAVVSIVATAQIQDLLGQTYTQKSGGTGFIITSDGMIMTNRHVISDKNGKYTVVTNDGKTYDAKVVSLDPANDLGVLKIQADNLSVVSFGDSSKLEVGQRVIAIGNALGEYQNTVTAGVISAINRTIVAGDGSQQSERLENVIQTDAAINAGNSGGPLINLEGQVIGVNTAMDQGGQLISFAIPSNVAKEAMDSVLKHGKIIRPYLGVRYEGITKELAEINHLAVNRGALVYSGSQDLLAVIPDSPAAKAGLQVNDIITKVNGDEIDQQHSLSQLLQKYDPGTEVELTILRDKNEIKVKVKLEAQSE